MEFYEAVEKRRTIRDFTSEQLPREVIERVIAAGMKAPTNDHMRDWEFVVITDKAVARRCVERIPEEFSDEDVNAVIRDWNLDDPCQQDAYKDAIPKQYRMLTEAPCLIIPLLKQKTNILSPESLSQLNGFASIWCCIENIFLAATAEGLACTLRIPLGDEAEWVRSVLKFPQEYFMPCFVAMGRPAENAVYVKQKPFSLEQKIHNNRW